MHQILGQSVVLLGSDTEDFLGGTMDKNLSANAGDMGLIPGLGRFQMLNLSNRDEEWLDIRVRT